ncbi:MAG: hypothetical protein EYC70_03140 [Planctomycetota bacterium]|nr:MAG: hypothetical protein EYC70_03140 [Planctomycetota bacterium]
MAVCAGLFLILAAQEPLPDPVAVAWRPRDGAYAVLAEAGQRLCLFDAQLRPLGQRVLDRAFRDVAADASGWLLQDPSGAVAWLPSLEAAPLPFSASVGADLFPRGGAGARTGPAGRALLLEAEHGRLRLGLAGWEHAGELEWGPAWATLRVRAARVLGPSVEWRRNGGGARAARVRADRTDPLLQRASFAPLAAGDVLELRLRPPTLRYPDADWTPWLRFEVPAVEPGAARPVSVLPAEL